MKTELSKIVQDLEQGTITETEAQNLLLDLLNVSESNLYDLLAVENNLIETRVSNVWVKNEPRDSLFKTTYTLTKLGFKANHKYSRFLLWGC